MRDIREGVQMYMIIKCDSQGRWTKDINIVEVEQLLLYISKNTHKEKFVVYEIGKKVLDATIEYKDES